MRIRKGGAKDEVRSKGRHHDDDVYGHAPDVHAHDSLCSETLKRFPFRWFLNERHVEAGNDSRFPASFLLELHAHPEEKANPTVSSTNIEPIKRR